jgi:hypothetical protein
MAWTPQPQTRYDPGASVVQVAMFGGTKRHITWSVVDPRFDGGTRFRTSKMPCAPLEQIKGRKGVGLIEFYSCVDVLVL